MPLFSWNSVPTAPRRGWRWVPPPILLVGDDLDQNDGGPMRRPAQPSQAHHIEQLRKVLPRPFPLVFGDAPGLLHTELLENFVHRSRNIRRHLVHQLGQGLAGIPETGGQRASCGRGGGKERTHVMHSRGRMTIDPRMPTMPGRSTSTFQPTRQALLAPAGWRERGAYSIRRSSRHKHARVWVGNYLELQ